MAAQTLPAIKKYTSRGTTKWCWLPAVANPAAGATRTEINQGFSLGKQASETSGWSVAADSVETPDIDDLYTPEIDGPIKAETSSVTMYMDENGVDARSLMPRGEEGFIAILDGGDVPGNLYDLYPVRVKAVSKMRMTDGSKADQMNFQFAITDAPSENLVVPA